MIIVTASARKIGFGTLDPYFGLRLWTQTSGLGLQASDLGLRTQACQKVTRTGTGDGTGNGDRDGDGDGE